MTRRPVVAVVGPGETDDQELLDAASAVGAGLARAGVVVVTGGLGGVMAAAARGAARAGGLVVGVLPGESTDTANDWVDVALPTGMGEGRNILVVRAARAVVTVGGSWGTLAEVALARRLDIPVVAVRGWRVDDAGDDGLVHVESAEAAVTATLSAVAPGGP